MFQAVSVPTTLKYRNIYIITYQEKVVIYSEGVRYH